jgi:translocation and assembly module TamB
MLTYEQALGSTESLVKLTFTLSRHLSLIGRAGADNAIDLVYTFTFGR